MSEMKSILRLGVRSRVYRICFGGLIVAAFAGFFATDSAKAIAIDDFASAENDRFANSASFIMDQFDLSGVGRSSDERWGTLLSRNVVVSANHFHPAIGETVKFFETNDPSGNSVTRTVSSQQRIDSSDIWVAALNSPVPLGYAFYDFATEDINSSVQFGLSSFNEVNAYLFGRSPTGFGSDTDVAVGRNELDGWVNNATAGGTTDDAMTAEKEAEAQDVTYESFLESGDSGGPMFVDAGGGNLTLVGTNWFVTDIDDDPNTVIGESNGFAYLGNYDEEIQNFIDAHFIPEPSALILLWGLAATWLMLRRRRRC